MGGPSVDTPYYQRREHMLILEFVLIDIMISEVNICPLVWGWLADEHVRSRLCRHYIGTLGLDDILNLSHS